MLPVRHSAPWDTTSSSAEIERVNAFAEAIQPAGITPTGAAVNLASGLLMAAGPETHPPLQVEMTRKLWKAAGWG